MIQIQTGDHEKGKIQRDLAKKYGLSQSTISKFLNGKASPKLLKKFTKVVAGSIFLVRGICGASA